VVRHKHDRLLNRCSLRLRRKVFWKDMWSMSENRITMLEIKIR